MIKLVVSHYDRPGGNLLDTWTDCKILTFRTNEHGFASLLLAVSVPVGRAYQLVQFGAGNHISVAYGGGVAWEGRIEDPTLVAGGVEIAAYGYWRALQDIPYTGLWSSDSFSEWRPTDALTSAFSQDRYETDTNNRLYWAPRKDENFGSNHRPDIASFYLQVPEGSRNFRVIQFDYEINLPLNWRLDLRTRDNWSTNFLVRAIDSTGSIITGSICNTFTARPIVEIFLLYTLASTTLTDDTGENYAKVTNLRVATSIENMVSTTLGGAVSAGSQTVTPASMENIYVGQRLTIDSGNSGSESVVVNAVTSTTFTAVFSKGHTAGVTVRGIVVYADEIVKDIVTTINGINPDHLSASPARIQSPRLDLHDEVYEDESPADILRKLAQLGDNQFPPQVWETGVWEGQMVHFRPKGTDYNHWGVSMIDPQFDSTLENFYNSAYAVYRDANGENRRTAIADDDTSQAVYGLTRRRAVPVSSTSQTEAEIQRDTALNDQPVPAARGAMTVGQLRGKRGGVAPKWLARSGDVISITNIAPYLASMGGRRDDLGGYRLAETEYDAIADILTPAPETPEPSLDQLVARRSEGF